MTNKQITEPKNGFYCIEPCSEIKELQADLKRKEQECEKLRFPMKDTNYAILTKEEFEEYDQLKAENKKLKEELETVYDDCKGCSTCNEALYNGNLYAKEYKKLKQTLEEIKSLCFEQNLESDFFACEILQKINEVENEKESNRI